MKLTFHAPHYRLSPTGSKALVVINKHYPIVMLYMYQINLTIVFSEIIL